MVEDDSHVNSVPLESTLLLFCVRFASTACISALEMKMCLLRKTKVKHVYLFLLCGEGHCFHGDSLMASFASLFFAPPAPPHPAPIPSNLQYLCLNPPHDHCASCPPPSFFFTYSLLFIRALCSISLPL